MTFFRLQIEADLLGQIAHLHLRIADLNPQGPNCPECLTLAELASHAVDFPKTGTPVDNKKLPRADRLKPDFLAGEIVEPSAQSNFYPSKKALGVLYRNVPLENDDAFHNPSVFGEKITSALNHTARRLETHLGLPSIINHPEELLEEMDNMMTAYADQLMEIAKTHSQSRNPDAYLTEPELISGTIQGKAFDHRKRREAVVSMNFQASTNLLPSKS